MGWLPPSWLMLCFLCYSERPQGLWCGAPCWLPPDCHLPRPHCGSRHPSPGYHDSGCRLLLEVVTCQACPIRGQLQHGLQTLGFHPQLVNVVYNVSWRCDHYIISYFHVLKALHTFLSYTCQISLIFFSTGNKVYLFLKLNTITSNPIFFPLLGNTSFFSKL